MSVSRTLGWLPAFFVGACAAVAAEVATGILLYADEGLMRSLSTVLATAIGALAAGLWVVPSPGPDLSDKLRRRWLMCLVAFLGAAIFGTSWTVVRDLGTGAVGQAMGLAVLAAFPLYACGSVLGGLQVASSQGPSTEPMPGPGAPAALGAAAGLAVAGFALPRAPMPSSLLIGCLVALSLGGLIFGIVLASRTSVTVRDQRTSPVGEVRVEDQVGPGRTGGTRALFVGGHLRRQVGVDDAGEPWDVSIARALMPDAETEWRVLALGGGASTLAKAVVREHPSARVDVLERTREVVDLSRDHLETELEVGEGNRRTVRVGNLDDLVDALSGVAYDLVVIDSAALFPHGGPAALSKRSKNALAARVGSSGALVWGPSTDGVTPPSSGWEHRVLTRDAGSGVAETVIVASPRPLDALGDGVAGFAVSNGTSPEP